MARTADERFMHEQDGEYHICIEGKGAFIVAETQPEFPLPHPTWGRRSPPGRRLGMMAFTSGGMRFRPRYRARFVASSGGNMGWIDVNEDGFLIVSGSGTIANPRGPARTILPRRSQQAPGRARSV